MKKITAALFGFLFLFTAFISAQDIITWNFSLEDAGNGEVNIVAKATVQQGWYMYDTKIPDGGPNPTMIEFDKITGAETAGNSGRPIRKRQ